jgi:hypothetical protein
VDVPGFAGMLSDLFLLERVLFRRNCAGLRPFSSASSFRLHLRFSVQLPQTTDEDFID